MVKMVRKALFRTYEKYEDYSSRAQGSSLTPKTARTGRNLLPRTKLGQGVGVGRVEASRSKLL